MDKKKKNLQEMYKLGFTNKTLSLLSESQIEMILEKIKKKEAKEVEQKTSLTFDPKADSKALSDAMNSKTYKSASTDPATGKVTLDMEESVEIGEGKKKKKKYNPWAVCTSSVGRKNKKKFEDCVMGVKKKLKEGRNPYEYLIESKMEEIVENNLSPKMTKGELLRIIAEKKMMMKKPIDKMMSMKGETMEGDTKTAPSQPKTTPKTEPARRTSNPAKNPNPGVKPKPKAKKQETSSSEMESKKKEIINAIFDLIQNN
jgi:hypothetical protein